MTSRNEEKSEPVERGGAEELSEEEISSGGKTDPHVVKNQGKHIKEGNAAPDKYVVDPGGVLHDEEDLQVDRPDDCIVQRCTEAWKFRKESIGAEGLGAEGHKSDPEANHRDINPI